MKIKLVFLLGENEVPLEYRKTLENELLEVNISTRNMKKTLMLNNVFISNLNVEKSLGGSSIKLIDIKTFNSKKIVEDEINIKMMSPLCIREHEKGKSDYYYSIKSSIFEKKAEEIIKKQIKDELKLEKIDFKIEPILSGKTKKTVVKHYNQNIEVTIGLLKLKSNTNILQHLYDNGIGSRKSAGFGMFEII